MNAKRLSNERFDAVRLYLEIERERLVKEARAHENEGRKEAAEAALAIHDALVEALCELRRLRGKERQWDFVEKTARMAGYVIDWQRAEEMVRKEARDA